MVVLQLLLRKMAAFKLFWADVRGSLLALILVGNEILGKGSQREKR